MSDLKITIKPYRGGSLGLRVFFLCLALLVIPLFFHAFFLYRQEYKQKLEDVKMTLRVIGEGQKALLEERIQLQKYILDAGDANHSILKERLEIVEIPHVQTKTVDFAIISQDGQFLWVGKQTEKNKANVIATPIAVILDQLIHFEDAPYLIAVAFIDGEGSILAGKRQDSSLGLDFPVEGASFTLALTVDETSINYLQKRTYFFRFLSFFFFVGILGGALVWALMRRISRPLKSLCTVMERVGEGAVHIRYSPDWMGFEINALGNRFNQMLDSALQHIQEAEKQRLEREKLAEELRIGHEIQLGLLPSHLPEFKEMDIGSGFLPAREVGGDFYDVFRLTNGSLFIAIADTAGKGISACLYSLGLRSILKSLASLSSDLSEIILRANDLFLQDVKHSGMFVTLWAAIYDPVDQSLVYCSQGHPPAILLRKGKEEELWTAGISLGAQTLDVVSVKTVKLAKGDLLFLYTDGVIEAHDEDRNLFGKKRLSEFLVRSEKLGSSEITENLLEEISLFSQGVPQHDDIAVLAIGITQSHREGR